MNAKAFLLRRRPSRRPKRNVWRTPTDVGGAAERESEVDQQFVNEFADAIVRQFPGSPSEEASRIASHACRKYSGRVGRSAAAKRLDPEPVRLAVIAAVRHQFTNYDTLLLQGIERHEARALVSSAVERKLGEWSGGERVTEHRLWRIGGTPNAGAGSGHR